MNLSLPDFISGAIFIILRNKPGRGTLMRFLIIILCLTLVGCGTFGQHTKRDKKEPDYKTKIQFVIGCPAGHPDDHKPSAAQSVRVDRYRRHESRLPDF